MEISFSSRKLEKQLTGEQEMRQAYGDLSERLKRRLDLLKAANTLATCLMCPHLAGTS